MEYKFYYRVASEEELKKQTPIGVIAARILGRAV